VTVDETRRIYLSTTYCTSSSEERWSIVSSRASGHLTYQLGLRMTCDSLLFAGNWCLLYVVVGHGACFILPLLIISPESTVSTSDSPSVSAIASSSFSKLMDKELIDHVTNITAMPFQFNRLANRQRIKQPSSSNHTTSSCHAGYGNCSIVCCISRTGVLRDQEHDAFLPSFTRV
jgi:hypothetical protein